MQEFVRYDDVGIDALTPYPGNARRGDVDGLVKSIQKNGQYRTIVVREIDNGPLIILAGNHTTEALKRLGVQSVRCEILKCSDEEARRINLADNRFNDLATYDPEAMAVLLDELNGDYAGTGWDANSAKKYLVDDEDEPMPDEDPTFGVIVNCVSEEQQSTLLERLSEEGFSVRALMA
jgi:hypothetical protein